MQHLPILLEGGTPPRYSVRYGGIDAFNAQTMEQKKSLSLSEVLRQLDETHRRLIDFVHSAPDDQFTSDTRFRHRLRLDTYSHYPKHAEGIWRWRTRREPAPGKAAPLAITDATLTSPRGAATAGSGTRVSRGGHRSRLPSTAVGPRPARTR